MHSAPACRSAVLIRVLPVATLLIGLSAVGIGWAGADPNALWTIVHDQCSPHEEQDGDPAPCALVDAEDGYALLKDLVGERQFLLIPTLQITGIESPILLDPRVKDYFADAWRARYLIEERAGRSLRRMSACDRIERMPPASSGDIGRQFVWSFMG